MKILPYSMSSRSRAGFLFAKSMSASGRKQPGKLRILFLTVVVAMVLSIAGCAKPVEEADVVGTYVKNNEQPVKFSTSATLVNLEGTEGKVTLQLREGGKAELVGTNAPLFWRLVDGRVTLYFMNASSSGDFKGTEIVGLGGADMIWTKK